MQCTPRKLPLKIPLTQFVFMLYVEVGFTLEVIPDRAEKVLWNLQISRGHFLNHKKRREKRIAKTSQSPLYGKTRLAIPPPSCRTFPKIKGILVYIFTLLQVAISFRASMRSLTRYKGGFSDYCIFTKGAHFHIKGMKLHYHSLYQLQCLFRTGGDVSLQGLFSFVLKCGIS